MNDKTDWNTYYTHPNKTAQFTRKITGRVLVHYIKKYVGTNDFTIVELGGGNSCFFELLEQSFSPREYIVVDNNQAGLSKFIERTGEYKHVSAYYGDVLDMNLSLKADLVFSIGLIEHFSVEETRKAIMSHFKVAGAGGIVIMSFPTPTALYRLTRKASELMGLWIFHDERPLRINEVINMANKYGEVLDQRMIWSIFLTQGVIVAKNA
jgi:hypothetical protein